MSPARPHTPLMWLALPLACAIGVAALGAVVRQSGDATGFERWLAAQPRLTVPVAAPGAAVVIVKFTDYQCPACAYTYAAFRPVLAKWEARAHGAVKVVSKNFPLNSNCNASLARVFHPAACEAAVAAVLAASRGRAAVMEDWLYGNYATLTPASVRQAALAIGRVPDMTSGAREAIDAIRADVALGRLLGVTQTPTFFINGIKVARPTVLQPDELDVAIAYELRRAGRIK